MNVNEELISDATKELQQIHQNIATQTALLFIIPVIQMLFSMIVILFAHYVFTCQGPNCIH